MGYAFMTIEKIKTTAQMNGKYGHNFRMIEVSNADASLSHLNEELVKLNGKTYVDAYNERMEKLGYGLTEEGREKDPNLKKVRKNAVLGFEVVTTFSREEKENVDLEKWKADNVKWLKETFNPSKESIEKNGDNVLSVVYHGDEAGNVHCHAFIIPIDDKGNLNSRFYVQNRTKLIHMQDSYGKLMKQNHNLDRGLKGAKSRHKDIKRYYAALNMNLEKTLPPPFLSESAFEYRERANQLFVDTNLKAMALQDKVDRLNIEKEHLEKTSAAEIKKKIINTYEEEFEKVRECEQQFGSVEKTIEKARNYDNLEAGITTLPKEQQETFYHAIDRLMLAGEQKKKKEKNKER